MVSSTRSRRVRAAIAMGLVGAVALASVACSSDSSTSSSTPSPSATPTADDLAALAYTYTYPLVSVEVTRRQSTNLPAPDPSIGAAPMNQLAPLNFLPDAKFTGVVRPNVDTLYTSMFFDVSQEPLVVSVPDMGGRYHLFPILDAWTNVDASAGPRTLGDVHGYQFALVGPNFTGSLPDGVHEYKLPTDSGWMIGRIQVNGPDDVPNVIAIQNQMTAIPLSAYGTAYAPPVNTDLHPDRPKDQAVGKYIHDLTPQQYWDLYYTSLSHAQTRPGDKAVLDQLATIGWSPDKKLDLSSLPEPERARWEQAWPKALSKIEADLGNKEVNGWKIARSDIGDYGTNYAARALVAYGGLGANLPQDAIYPATRVDDQNTQLIADRTYVLHFAADQIPPVKGFWSLTMYNEQGFFVDNPINRYAVRGERLTNNPDGSVDIYIQRENPGPEKESNWLPTPASGDFNLMLRTYWPDQAIVDGSWNPPAVTRTN
ncbi:DUF1254 domain-containing protein [Nocardia otitidiscaviarum]|uniref:DUF1254 domain-containing protein n=1 Tax=Nocardia otitidiscaviarum TaxID=1823 RepID=UPI0018935389|nr:DUF1254 domain-containing protein [Nocardia otitidiscaviarum]MBF6241032.1 DUF1254 domain-containing protein [Nocardia otitidiscaviarum]